MLDEVYEKPVFLITVCRAPLINARNGLNGVAQALCTWKSDCRMRQFTRIVFTVTNNNIHFPFDTLSKDKKQKPL